MKARVLKTLKSQTYVSLVLLESVRVNKQVVEIGAHEIVKIFLEGVVDEVLKRARSIAKAKRHNLIFIKSISTAEGCFPFFPSGDPKAIVSISHIEFGEVFWFAQVAKQLADRRERVVILDCDPVKATIIIVIHQVS